MSLWFCSDCKIAYGPGPFCPRCGKTGTHQNVELDPVVVNQQIEQRWRSGAITWEAMDWWLRTVNGV